MYKKLILENHSEPFRIVHNGKTHDIPSGKFEAESNLGNFIIQKSKQFEKNVIRLDEPEAPKVDKIKSREEKPKEDEPKEEIEEEEEKKEKDVKKKKKK